MTDRTFTPAFSFEDLALGGGITTADQPLLTETFRQLITRLDALNEQVSAEVSIKDRDSSDPRTTLEVWIHGRPRLVATSHLLDQRAAFNDVASAMIAQLNESSGRREPKNNRQRRESIRTR